MKVGKSKDGSRFILLEDEKEVHDVKEAIYIQMKAADEQGKKQLASRLEEIYESL